MMNDIHWRPYQKNCFNAVYDQFKNHGVKKQLVVQATGLGKRLQAVNISTKFKGKSLFLAHSEELIEQAYLDMERFHGFTNVGIVKGPRFEIDRKVVVASPQTMINRLDRIDPKHFDLVQVDEAHRYMARTFVDTVNHFKPKLRLGWTATPYRLDGLSLSGIFDRIVYEYNIADGIKDGYLAELDGIRIKTNVGLGDVHRRMGDFAVGELSDKVDIPERNDLIVESYRKYADGKQAIGFCVDVQHCINLQQHFLREGIPCEIIVADESVCPDRKGVNERFRNGTTRILLNVQILIEGWDYSDVGAVLMVRPTQSLTFYMQAIGRGTRIKSNAFIEQFGKNECKVLDFVDVSGRHNLINTWTLDKESSAKNKIFVNTEKREKLISAEEERARREAKVLSEIIKDTRFDLLKLPDVKVWEGEWQSDEATEAQISYLKKLGLYEDGMAYTKGMCSELLNNAPATNWQLKLLKQWGYDISAGATNGQYSKAKQKLMSDHKYDPGFNANKYRA